MADAKQKTAAAITGASDRRDPLWRRLPGWKAGQRQPFGSVFVKIQAGGDKGGSRHPAFDLPGRPFTDDYVSPGNPHVCEVFAVATVEATGRPG
jgi:hypothetical protein